VLFNTLPAGSNLMSMSLCVCVCLSICEDISRTTRAIFTIFVVHVAYGSVLLQHHCITSGFVDDIMFVFCDGPYSGMNFATED